MIAPCIVDGDAFVGCPTRLGSINRDGPVTGKKYTITPTGVWIDEDDAAVLTEIKEDVYCFRAGGNININTVFYLNPDANQVEMRKNNG